MFYSVWVLAAPLRNASWRKCMMQNTSLRSALPIKSNGGILLCCSQLQHSNLVGFVDQVGLARTGTLGSWKRVNCGKLNSFTPLLFTQFLSMRAEDKSFFRQMVPSSFSIDSVPCLSTPKKNYLVLGPSEDSCQFHVGNQKTICNYFHSLHDANVTCYQSYILFLTSSPVNCPRWKARRGNGVKQEEGGSWPQNYTVWNLSLICIHLASSSLHW